MRIGVVVPAYNAEQYLREALESVLDQIVHPDVVIVVDDGSSDGTVRIAAAMGPPVSVVSFAHAGIGAARNAGVARIDCDVLAFIDADDRWLPEKLERQRAALASDASLGFVVCQVRAFASPELPEPERAALLAEQPSVSSAWLPSALAVRRNAFRRVGGFAEDLVLGEAIDWFNRARHLGVAGRELPEVLAERRLHRRNTTRLRAMDRRDYIQVAKRHLDRMRGI